MLNIIIILIFSEFAIRLHKILIFYLCGTAHLGLFTAKTVPGILKLKDSLLLEKLWRIKCFWTPSPGRQLAKYLDKKQKNHTFCGHFWKPDTHTFFLQSMIKKLVSTGVFSENTYFFSICQILFDTFLLPVHIKMTLLLGKAKI